MEPNLPDLFELYFDERLAGTPYRDAAEELSDRAYLADMYLHCALLLCGQAEDSAPAPGDAARLARAAVMEAFRFNRGLALADGPRAEIWRAWEHTRARSAARPGILSEIISRFAPGIFSQFCLFLAAAARMERRHDALLAHLQGDAGCVRPTVAFAWELCRLTEELPFALCLEETHSRAWDLLFETQPDGAFCLRENVIGILLGARVSGAREGGLCEPLAHRALGGLSGTSHGGQTRERVLRAVRRAREQSRTLAVVLWGPEGSGRMHTALACAAAEGWDLLLLRGDALAALDGARLHERALRAASDAAVSGFVPVVTDADALGSGRAAGLCEELGRCGVRALFLLAHEPDALVSARGCIALRFGMEEVSAPKAVELWREGVAGAPLAPGTDLRYLSSKYRLSPGQIIETAGAAALLAPGDAVGEADLAAAAAGAGQGALSRQCVRIAPVFTFDDLVLPPAARRQVRAILDRVRDAYRVNIEWGFGERYAYGRGIGVLLYGRPGTGKTMCAQVLAHELQLELYKVDLSQLVSKYIGETEKNISDIFSNARRSNAILFFDEADSLFSRRAVETGAANDKYANMETAHLLQKMEEFDGITILATNLAGTFDKAFYRRLQFVINIPLPDEETRLSLWRRSFPARCPLDASVDFVPLARRHETSPSTIKAAALGAAFCAAQEGAPAVAMRHILLALRDELAKEGKSLSRADMLGFEPG